MEGRGEEAPVLLKVLGKVLVAVLEKPAVSASERQIVLVVVSQFD